MPPKERLLFWDSKRPEVTVKLFKFVGRQAVPGLTTAAIAKKWIANLGTDGVSAGLGDGLDNDNTENTYRKCRAPLLSSQFESNDTVTPNVG